MNCFTAWALFAVAAWTNLAACGQTQDEVPPVFSNLEFDKAVAQNKTDDKILVVKSTASWCGPCKLMDRTTWRDEKIVTWFKTNGVAIVFDVDKEPALAKKLVIEAMPTMIAFRKGEEFDRIVGYKDATDFLEWIEGVKNGKKSIEAVISRAQNAQKGSDEEIKTRYDLAQKLQQSGQLEKATEEYVWLWTHAPGTSYGPVRSSFMASNIKQLVAKHPPAKERFVQFRDEAAKLIQGEKVDADALDDWLVLNDVVGESKQTLEWFQTVKSEPRWMPLLRRESYRIEDLLWAGGLWTDVALLHPDPVGELQHKLELNEMTAKYREGKKPDPNDVEHQEFDRRSMRQRAGKLYAAMLAASRVEDSQAVVKKILEIDDSSATRLELVYWALEAKQPRAEHGVLLDEAQKKGDAKEVAKLRGELAKALNPNDGK
jgi:thioredoxin-like negative regulator of GroEL